MSDRGPAQKSAPKYRPRHRVTPVPSTSASTRALTVGSVALTLPAVVVGFGPATSAQAASTPTKPTAPKPTVPLSPTPKPAKPLSKIIDIASSYQPQDSCDPVAKPGVTAFMNLMLTTYKTGVSAGITRLCGIGGPRGHKEGRARDWPNPPTTQERAPPPHRVGRLAAP